MEQLEINRIIDQIERLYGDNWSEVNFIHTLDEIDHNMANEKLPLFSNTIHQIAHHLLATEQLVIGRLKGKDYKLTREEDWVPTAKLEQLRWSETKKAIRLSKIGLIKELQKLMDSCLDTPILENHATFYVTIQGHLQHSYYHIGQISIIKKIIERA